LLQLEALPPLSVLLLVLQLVPLWHSQQLVLQQVQLQQVPQLQV
jgi:hypothetical protein